MREDNDAAISRVTSFADGALLVRLMRRGICWQILCFAAMAPETRSWLALKAAIRRTGFAINAIAHMALLDTLYMPRYGTNDAFCAFDFTGALRD